MRVIKIADQNMTRREAELIATSLLPMLQAEQLGITMMVAMLLGHVATSEEAAPLLPPIHDVGETFGLMRFTYQDDSGWRVYPDVAAIVRGIYRHIAHIQKCDTNDVSLARISDWLNSLKSSHDFIGVVIDRISQ